MIFISRKNQIQLVSWAVWLVGAVGLYFLWNFHFRNNGLDIVWGSVLYVVAFFYIFVLWPIHNAVDRAMPTEKRR
jgi:RsiW-degrading membrane proteinase PrsW (M82 family)